MTTTTTSELEELVKAEPIRAGRPIAWAIMAVLFGAGVWTSFAHLTEVSTASGAVIPQGQVRTVQHLEGGIVSGIYVRDGDVVTAGQSLLQVELAPKSSNPEELRARLDGYLIVRARLTAESARQPPQWPQDAVARQPQIAAAEVQSYESRRAQLETSLAVLQQQVQQRQLEVKEFESQRASLQAELSLATEKLKMSEGLLRDNLVTRIEHLELERVKQQLEGQINTISVSIPRAQAAHEEATRKVDETRLQFLREVQTAQAENEVNITRTEQLLAEATRQQERTTITAPIDGVIKNVKVRSLGDVVKPGEPIMEVVPITTTLVIEGKLSPTDRGYVVVGQDAVVKISAYDYVKYGGLHGKVILIGADADLDEKGNPYFRVQVQTDKSYFGTAESPMPVSSGMQATVDIITGSKSVLAYLIKPVLKIRLDQI